MSGSYDRSRLSDRSCWSDPGDRDHAIFLFVIVPPVHDTLIFCSRVFLQLVVMMTS